MDSATLAENNIADADATHDLGQSGRVGRDDLALCRLALADMMMKNVEPTAYVNDATCLSQLNEGLSQITGGEVTSTSGAAYGTYERHYANTVFPAGYQQVSFQNILAAYKEWEDARKPGERPTGWLDYTGFRNNEIKATDVAKLAALGIDKSSIPVGAQALLANPRSNYGSLEITWNDEDASYQEWDMYEPRNQRIICDFIGKYLYPGRNTIDKGVFVFDANAGSIKELFDSLNQISSEINPMVLADSAGTCMHQLGEKGSGRNAYCFPFNRPGATVFDTAANVHTSNFQPDPRVATQFYFVRSNDEDGDPIDYEASTYNIFTFGFVITFTNPGAQPVKREWTVPFSADGPSSGPSVPYLGEVIATIRRSYYANQGNTPAMITAFQTANPEPSMRSIMNITPQIVDMMNFLHQAGVTTGHICLFVERLAMDVKKCGDWEQIRSVSASMATCPTEVGTAMMCTGDFLCSAKARLDGLNGVWHNEGEGGATGWKLQLFRSPDLSDPNMAQAVTIIDLARRVLPIITFTAKPGPHQLFQRLTQLRDKTLHAVQLYRGLIGEPENAPVGENPFKASPIAFANIFTTMCLSNVCASAIARLTVLQQNEQLTAELGTNLQGVLTTAKQAIADFAVANQSGQLGQYVAQYQPAVPDFEKLNNTYSPLLPTFLNTLTDLGFSSEGVDSLTTSDADLDASDIDNLVCKEDAQVIIESNKLNPAFECGDVFHYTYDWITIVGAKQGYLHSVILPELIAALAALNVTMTTYANKQAMDKDVVGAMRSIGDGYNRVVNLLKTGNDFFKNTRGNDSYKKAADRATNFDDVDFSALAKNALLVSIKVPPQLGRRGNTLDEVVEKYGFLRETVDQFQKLSADAADVIWRQLLPRFYNKIGLPADPDVAMVGGTQSGGMGGPTDMTIPINVDVREQDALKKYFNTLISTVIGYCRNATNQVVLYEDANSATNYMQVLSQFPNKNASAYNLARAAFFKGCLVHPTANRLVYGPRTRTIDALNRYLQSSIMVKLAGLFGLVNAGNTPKYYLPALDPATQTNIYNLVTGKTIEELAQMPDAFGAADVPTIQKTLVFLTFIGDIWNPTIKETFENAYDNLYVSNVNPLLPATQTIFQAQPINYDQLMQLPYVARCVNEQIVFYPPREDPVPAGGLAPAEGVLLKGKYAAVSFIKSQLTEIILDKNPLARWASLGRFNVWADLSADDTAGAVAATPAADFQYPGFTTEKQFTQDVIDDIFNASVAVTTGDVSGIDVTKLSFGIANIPRSYYLSSIGDVTDQVLSKAVENANALVAEAIQLAEQQGAAALAAQQRQQQQLEVYQQNQMLLKNLLAFAVAYRQHYLLPQTLQQNAAQAEQVLALNPQQFSQTLPTLVTVGAGKRKSLKKRRRAKKTRGRKHKKGTKRNKRGRRKTKNKY